MWKSEEQQVKGLLVVMICVLCIVLVPLFVMAHYNFMSADDYSFGINAAKVWKETGSVFQVLVAQLGYTKDMYFSWQGTFFDVWLTTSLTGIFGENAYYMGTYLSLGGMVAAQLWALITILVKCLGAKKADAAIISISYICMQVLLAPAPMEGFYWFCGAMRYTFIHGLAWVLVLLFVLTGRNEKPPVWKAVLLEVAMVLLSVAIAGSNYITAITILLIYVLHVGQMFYRKHPGKIAALCNSVLFLALFIVNMAAPGNQRRQQVVNNELPSVIETIISSIQAAVEYVAVNAIPPCIVLALMLIPLFLRVVKARNYKYPMPLLVSIISCGVFAAQFAPNMYALQFIGTGRVLNLYRFNFYLLLYANELYWIGWLWRKFRERYGETALVCGRGGAGNVELDSACGDAPSGNADAPAGGGQEKASWILPGWGLGMIVLCVCLHFWGGSTVTTVSAVESLRSGSAAQYYAEYQERMRLLRDESLKEVYLEPLSQKPYLLYYDDIEADTDDWINNIMEQFYDKEIVGLNLEE